MKRARCSRGIFLYCLIVSSGLLLLTSGCASIINGSKQEMTFNSDPAGAKVTIGERIIGITPITTSIDRRSNQTLIFEKEGYNPVKIQLTTTINPWFWGNILIGGVIGSTTDGFSGAYNEYAPSKYLIPLAPIEDKKVNLKINKKIFAMMNYNQLVNESYTEPGEYTKALIILMGVEKGNEDSMIDAIRNIAKTTNDGLAFAEKVTAISDN